jgi:vanillate O-demethylase ferredoxin subunit
MELVVARKRSEARDVASFELRRADGGELPPFTAGAHIDVTAPNGLVRQYSLCNAPSERHRYQIAVLRDPASRGGSRALVDGLDEGARVLVGAPRNHFALVPARHTLLLAGGIGVTPLLSMAEALHADGAAFSLHYCARSRERAAFIERIGASFGPQATIHLDDGAAAQRLDLDSLLQRPDPDTHIYICGPSGFIAVARGAAVEHGWSAAQVHVEHFAAPVVQRAPADGFEVRIASSGKLVYVAPECSVADALAGEGIALPVSCGEGVCGSCITRVLEGVPDHRDEFFSEDEKARNDRFMPCCSRALSPVLVLDL